MTRRYIDEDNFNYEQIPLTLADVTDYDDISDEEKDYDDYERTLDQLRRFPL